MSSLLEAQIPGTCLADGLEEPEQRPQSCRGLLVLSLHGRELWDTAGAGWENDKSVENDEKL